MGHGCMCSNEPGNRGTVFRQKDRNIAQPDDGKAIPAEIGLQSEEETRYCGR